MMTVAKCWPILLKLLKTKVVHIVVLEGYERVYEASVSSLLPLESEPCQSAADQACLSVHARLVGPDTHWYVLLCDVLVLISHSTSWYVILLRGTLYSLFISKGPVCEH